MYVAIGKGCITICRQNFEIDIKLCHSVHLLSDCFTQHYMFFRSSREAWWAKHSNQVMLIIRRRLITSLWVHLCLIENSDLSFGNGPVRLQRFSQRMPTYEKMMQNVGIR